MSIRFDCDSASSRSRGLARAVQAVESGEVVVLPTDTVYGIACDAFSFTGIAALEAARGGAAAARPPVVIPHARTLDGIAARVSQQVRALAESFWPGPLTLICWAQPTLQGDFGATVAIRMPLHPVALELLARTGPLALTSANRIGAPPPVDCDQAQEQLGDAIRVYLDGGPVQTEPEPVLSTVIDGTGDVPRLLRAGAVQLADLRSVAPDLQPSEPEELEA